jgi:glycine cleavage system aminomethyltransferase T
MQFSPQRRSPFHNLLRERGAIFDGTSGWLYPLWFSHPAHPGRWEALRHEQWLVRNRVGVFDGTCLAQVVIAGPDSLRLLNQLSTRDHDVKPGTATYAQWCDDDGRLLLDAIVTRVSTDRFEVTVNDTLQHRTLALANAMAAELDAAVVVFDTTSAIASLIVSGPLTRDVLQPLTEQSLAADAFLPMQANVVEVAGVELTMNRISYMGELTFELHMPTEYGWSLASELFRQADLHGGGPVGLEAVYALGTEHGMLDFDYSLDNTLTPLEAGLARGIAWDKPDGFRGINALRSQRASGTLHKRVGFVHVPLLDGADSLVLTPGDRVVRNGEVVTTLLTVDPCHAIRREVATAILSSASNITDEWISTGTWHVESESSTVPVTVTTSALYDPSRSRSRHS